MSHDLVLSVNGLSKKCCSELQLSLRYGLQDVLSELLPGRSGKLRPGEFWSLDDISFELRQGEALAILGRNGAGKSTLLKLLCGLLKPDRGEIRLHGRAEALIELGTGFNPLLTGRENILVGAAQHGLSASRSREFLDEVIDFSELEAAIDSPFQTYSSGMKARLAYALAAQLQPDIFLIDEALAVGDHAFQRKCISHMRSYLQAGGALLLVSHNVYQIQSVCQRGILLERGKQLFTGSAVDAVARQFDDRLSAPPPTTQRKKTGPVEIIDIRAQSLNGPNIHTGEAVKISILFESTELLQGGWGFSIWTADGMVCVTGDYDPTERPLEIGTGEFSCVIPKLSLLPGRYLLRGMLMDEHTNQPLALFGWHGRGAALDVKATADAATNAQVHLGQLTKTHVEWE